VEPLPAEDAISTPEDESVAGLPDVEEVDVVSVVLAVVHASVHANTPTRIRFMNMAPGEEGGQMRQTNPLRKGLCVGVGTCVSGITRRHGVCTR